MRLLLAVIVIAGCERGSKPAPGKLDSPVAAARCEAAAMRAKDADALLACFHPDLRNDARRELQQRHEPFDWSGHAQELDKLEHATLDQFTIKPMPPERAAFGDQIASLRFQKDSLDVVHAKDGNWYIVDTGL